MSAEQDRRLAEEIARERPRLRNFIRRRVADEADVEDILQDVFAELVEAYRMMQSVEQVGAWLFQVARNRVIDLFRKRRSEARAELPDGEDDTPWEELVPSPEAGPEAAHARELLLDELANALQELPAEQREVFVAHEIEGKSFKQLAAETGVSPNTLLSRKRYAVKALQQRLQAIHDELEES